MVSQSAFMKTFFVLHPAHHVAHHVKWCPPCKFLHPAHLFHLDLVPVPVEVGAGETLEDFAHVCVRLHLVVARMRNCVEDDGEGD